MSQVYGFQKEGSFVVMARSVQDRAMTCSPSLLNSDLARERTRVTRRRIPGARLVRPAASDARDGAPRGGPNRVAGDR
jgi:hypothetical protein